MEGEARDIVKEGIISEVYPERHSARVVFEDKADLVSAELPILTTWALENKSYALPDVGECVVCLFATNDDASGTGWIIGSRFHEKSKPNAKSQDITRVDFKDGTSVEYDREKHVLKIECKGKLEIACEKEITITSEKDILITSDKNINLKGEKINLN